MKGRNTNLFLIVKYSRDYGDDNTTTSENFYGDLRRTSKRINGDILDGGISLGAS